MTCLPCLSEKLMQFSAMGLRFSCCSNDSGTLEGGKKKKKYEKSMTEKREAKMLYLVVSAEIFLHCVSSPL